MMRTSRSKRAWVIALGVGALAVLVGDRPVRALPPNVGIDPLEVLDLQIKPNVLIILDSSGSMTETPYNTPVLSGQIAGDFPRSKMFQAKDVLNQVIAANVDSASFMLAQYNQTGEPVDGPGARGELHEQPPRVHHGELGGRRALRRSRTVAFDGDHRVDGQSPVRLPRHSGRVEQARL